MSKDKKFISIEQSEEHNAQNDWHGFVQSDDTWYWQVVAETFQSSQSSDSQSSSLSGLQMHADLQAAFTPISPVHIVSTEGSDDHPVGTTPDIEKPSTIDTSLDGQIVLSVSSGMSPRIYDSAGHLSAGVTELPGDPISIPSGEPQQFLGKSIAEMGDISAGNLYYVDPHIPTYEAVSVVDHIG